MGFKPIAIFCDLTSALNIQHSIFVIKKKSPLPGGDYSYYNFF